MATEHAPNGSYATHQQSNGSAEQPTDNKAATPAAAAEPADVPKDEVGWYFVEQYYTTLSRSPEKIHLFYQKRSQFVYGTEEEKVTVCVGQKAINDRIKELDFHDSKVRITNVDSQGSDSNIVIQVIGEISNRQQPHRKFVQTFVLAAQVNGYFVLNDIFRYIADEEPEAEEEEAAKEEPAVVAETTTTTDSGLDKSLTNNGEAGAREADAAKVDQGLEDVIQNQKSAEETTAPPAAVNGKMPETTQVDVAEDAPVAVEVSGEKPSTTAVAASLEEEVKQPEKPKDPEPTRAAATPKANQAAPRAPSKPSAPKSWASLAAAANRVAMPQIASSSTNATTGAASKPVAAAAAQAPAVAPAAPVPTVPAAAAVAHVRDASPATSGADSSSDWQTADTGKRASRQITQAPSEEQGTRAYIKNVFEGVKEAELRATLSKFGEVAYLDISRPKNCAFVDFSTRAGFNAAVAANPHKIGGETIIVEERRTRPTSQFVPRGGAQRGGRGDARPAQGGRGGFKQEGGRGGFNPRGGRGGTSAPRGRGNSQAA